MSPRTRTGVAAGAVVAPRGRQLATALLLCVGMAVIPVIALAGNGDGLRGAAGATVAPPIQAAPAAVAAFLQARPGAAIHEVAATFSTPLAFAASAPAASEAAVLARRAVTASTAAPRPRAGTAVAAKPVFVASTAKPAPSAAPAAAANGQQGLASWYTAPHGTCAHPTLPFGTVLTVTDVATGRSVTCRVDDRGPYARGRVVDLSPDVFAQLAPLGVGVAVVRVTW